MDMIEIWDAIAILAIPILAITFTSGMYCQYYIGKALATMFRDHAGYRELDGLGGKNGKAN